MLCPGSWLDRGGGTISQFSFMWKGHIHRYAKPQMAKTGACMLDACVCPCLFGAGVKKRGSNVAANIPLLKMMTWLGLFADSCVAGVFSQGSGLPT